MKRALAILGIASAATVGTYVAVKQSINPQLSTQRALPYLTNATPSNCLVVFPDAFYQTNYGWFFEIADDLAGPWRYPDRQHPDETNWVIRLNGARFIRMHGVPY